MLCPTSALRLQGLYLLLVIYRAFSDAFHSQWLAASGRIPLLVKALLLKCFHLNALNIATFNLGAFNLSAFNLDTSVAVRQLASYYARLPFANHQPPLCSRRLRQALPDRRSLRTHHYFGSLRPLVFAASISRGQ